MYRFAPAVSALALALSGLGLAACSPSKPAETAKTAAPLTGVDKAGMDMAVKPGEDFFVYANGAWDKANEIPSDRSTWGTNQILGETVDKDVRAIIEGAAASSPAPGSQEAKIGDYYAAFMDEAGIEAKGAAPLKPKLDEIAAIKDKKSLSAYLGSTLRADVDVMNNTRYATDNVYGLWVAADFDEPTKYSPFLLQGGLSLPSRDYYIVNNDRMKGIREAFKAHIATVFDLAGVADSKKKAERVFDLETKIAKAHVSIVETGEPKNGQNHWPRADFDRRAPGMDWAAFLDAAGLSAPQTFVVWQPAAFIAESKLVASAPIDTWKDYLAFHYIDRNSGLLSKAFVDERFNMYGKTLSGTPALTDRWKRGVAVVNGALGEAVGKVYAEKHFPASSKAAVQEMVKNIQAGCAQCRHRLSRQVARLLRP
jgi:putative endopeptidase